MSHIILTGTTGTCGAAVLAHCLSHPSISQISILSRKPVRQAEGQSKARVILHQDFASYPDSLLQELKGATACIWSLGVSTSEVKAAEYKTITHTYPLAAAKAFSTISQNFNFVYVSGGGVTRNPSPLPLITPLFSRIKGQAETALLSLRTSSSSSLRVFNLRPAFIDEIQQPLSEKPKPTAYKLTNPVIGPVLRSLWPAGVSPTRELAEVLVKCALERGEKEEVRQTMGGKGVVVEEGEGLGVLLENVGIRRLAEI
ncbi:MAG: hypothetical protein Q9190_007375 [Brigantiaea leucoxantha]